MSDRSNNSQRRSVAVCQPLEERRLFFIWGLFPQMVGLDKVREQFPELTGAGESVALVDSGIDYNHFSLGSGFGPGHKIIAGYDFQDNDSDPFVTDDAHATGVAGVIGANRFIFNGRIYEGVAPQANIIALKQHSSGRAKLALQWVIQHARQYNIVAVNLTDFIGSGFHPTVYASELATLGKMGIAVISPVGNQGADVPIEYPGLDPNVIAVGAINRQDKISDFTQRGPKMALVAPGDGVTLPFYKIDTKEHIWTEYAQGTSWTAPHVTGAIMLLKQDDPTLTVKEMLKILQDSGQPRFDPVSNRTYKRLDIFAAIKLERERRASTGSFGTFNDIAYDSKGVLHLSYFDTLSDDLKYSKRSINGTWTQKKVIDGADGAGPYNSLALDSKGKAAIAYFDDGSEQLRYAREQADGSFRITIIDDTAAVGKYASLVFNAQGLPGISYYDETNGDLLFATMNKKGIWSTEIVDGSGNTGTYTSIAVNPASGRFAIAYANSSGGALKYAAQNAKGMWSKQRFDKTTGGGAYLSLAYDGSDRPEVSYYDVAKQDLKFARFNGKAWKAITIASGGNQGLYTHIVPSSSGAANIVFWNETTQRACLAKGNVNKWSIKTLASNGGEFLAVAKAKTGAVTLSSVQATGEDLRFDDISANLFK